VTCTKTCSYLPQTLCDLAEDEGIKSSLGADLLVTASAPCGVKLPHDTMLDGNPDMPKATLPVADWEKIGQEDQCAGAGLTLLIFLADSGIAFWAVDHPMFKCYTSIISSSKLSGLGLHSPSAMTIADCQ